MENWDQRRRHSTDERQQARSEDHGRDRGSWWRGERSHDDDRPRGAERGWLDYDREPGASGERQGRGDEQRFSQQRGDRSRFSPDWSRDNEQPRYSDEPYYSRNREQGGAEQYSRGGRSEGWEGNDQRRWEQRSRDSIPPEQHELAQRSQRGDYYDPDWPYDRGEQNRQGREGREGRDVQRSRSREDEGSHYRGWYSRSATPFSYAGGTGYLYAESLMMHGPHTGRGPKGYKRS